MSFPLPLDETKRLESLRLLEILDTAAEREFDDLTRLAARICEVPISAVSLIDADRQWFKSKVGLGVSETARDAAFCAHTILGRELFVVPDATEDARFAGNPLVTGDPNIRFYAGAPLVTDDGHALGSLCVIDTVARFLQPEQKESLEILARQASALLKRHGESVLLVRANQKLQASEESYRIVSESASDVIITINEESRIVFANGAAEKVFGYSPQELIGGELSIIVPERMRAAHAAGMRRYMQSGRRNIPWSGIRLPGLRRDGEEIQIEMSFGEYRQNGKRLFTAVIRDITEQRRIEARLRESEERYRYLSEAVPQQVWTALPDGRLDYGNHRTIEYFGEKTQSELFALRWTKILHPEDVRRTLENWTRSVETGEPYETEYRLRRSDGEYRWHLAQASPMHDDTGEITKWFGTNTDIHDRKIAEKAARESAQYRNLFQNANDAILVFEPDTEVIVDANDEACRMYGFERAEFIGRSIRELSQDAGAGEKHLRELIENGARRSFETVQFRSDGKPINLLINSSVIEYHGRQVVLSINRDITDRKIAEQQLLHNALHDALTGLPNRALFLEHLRHAIERNGTRGKKFFAVLFLDFDQFKIINDSLGHMEGDNLLRLIARRLSHSLRNGDIVARLGGDEFTILLDDLGDLADVMQVVERVQNDLKTPFDLSGRSVVISVSIGIALSDAAYTKPEEMVRDADIAMYRAKAGGKARHQMFNQTMHEQATERLQLETELRRAVELEEFLVYYQPIVDLQSGRTAGFEALVRWRHPSGGIVPPDKFIPIVEETGLIVPLGLWILRQSCRRLRRWQTENTRNSNLTMSVNLSCKQFVQTDLAERVAEILSETEIEAGSLRLEITESHLMEDSETAIRVMNRLRALGVKLSIDDFGTGYSSLSYLHRLPVSYLKIDRSFVGAMQTAPENREIVRTIIMLAKNLNLEVVAEGIEQSGQADYLKSLGCHFGQGYFYSKPVPAEQAGALITGGASVPASQAEATNLGIELINDAEH